MIMSNNQDPTILYISSANRSGSTLVERLLGNHSQIFSIGELRNLRGYLTDDRSFFDPVYPLKCFCGENIRECNFWNEVFRVVDSPIENMSFNFSFTLKRPRKNEADRLRRKFEKSFFEKHPEWFSNRAMQIAMGNSSIAENCFKLYRAVASVSGKKILIDSSKLAHRCYALYCKSPDRIKAIELYRHPLGVASSMKKRNVPIEKAARDWRQAYITNQIFFRKIPQQQRITMKYEDLCLDTQNQLKRICDFLNVEYEKEMVLNKRVYKRHSIGGSPSQYEDSAFEVVDKEEYRRDLSEEEQRRVLSMVGPIASKFGYG